ncbi:MAG: putative outer membrane protein, partial [Tardiphaga sp.]|nr:putative outer membrane protein [Tardiphaga sp.]
MVAFPAAVAALMVPFYKANRRASRSTGPVVGAVTVYSPDGLPKAATPSKRVNRRDVGGGRCPGLLRDSMIRHTGKFERSGWRAFRATVMVGVGVAGLIGTDVARAETVSEALVRAYQSNPLLNAERARQRATDENVPQALAAYRPQIVAGLSYGLQAVRNLLPDNTVQSATLKPWTIGLTVTQILFNGNRTANSVRIAELQVQSGREALRNTGQGVLLDAVTVYLNVLANQSLVEAQKSNVNFLQETFNITQKRLNAGDVTPTDTAQAEARLSRGRADLNAAEVALAVSQATYAQVIGTPPVRLSPAEPVDRLTPRSREDSVAQGFKQHPAVLAAGYDVDVASTTIRVAEGTLLPTVTLQGSASRASQSDQTLGTSRTDQASVLGNISAPIYDGGLAAAQTRQAKELSSQSRLVLEQVRNQIRTAATGAWAANEGAKVAVSAAESEVRAAGVALQGVQREAAGGQRTTLEVLNSQQDLILAKARLIGAQRDRVIASYQLLSAVGKLDVRTLGLNTPDYLPDV